MKKRSVLTLFIILMISISASAQDGGDTASSDNAALSDSSSGDDASGDSLSSRSIVLRMRDSLGQTLEELVESRGLPDDMYPLRGPAPGQDSVVFYYSDSFTYYLADGHVWQVRADRNDLFQGDTLSLGLPVRDVKAVMGEPQRRGEDYSIYSLDRSGFPVAAAFYFDGGLTDLYVYRSDF
jgi:hypothetical protein